MSEVDTFWNTNLQGVCNVCKQSEIDWCYTSKYSHWNQTTLCSKYCCRRICYILELAQLWVWDKHMTLLSYSCPADNTSHMWWNRWKSVDSIAVPLFTNTTAMLSKKADQEKVVEKVPSICYYPKSKLWSLNLVSYNLHRRSFRNLMKISKGKSREYPPFILSVDSYSLQWLVDVSSLQQLVDVSSLQWDVGLLSIQLGFSLHHNGISSFWGLQRACQAGEAAS